MTDYFKFIGLPLVVQDLITEEIVHNSIPEDRIELALTSKYCNELVQRARPKKVIDKFTVAIIPRFTFISNSTEYRKTKEQLLEIVPNCQIKQLKLYDHLGRSAEYSEILDMLSEPAKFATKLDIGDIRNPSFNVVEFYVKLKHLKSVTIRNPGLILPYYPSKVKLNFNYNAPSENILEDLAKKSQNSPLSFFELNRDVSLEKCQQFLQTTKFSIGAEIRIHVLRFLVCVTYLGQDIFTLEMFTKNSLLILISQKFVRKNRRIKLKTSFGIPRDITFDVISASNPNKKYYSGVFKENQRRMLIILENVDRDEILVVKFVDHITKKIVHPRYSAKMLESAFPTANFTTPEERVKKINNVLGTNIQLIQAENFVETVELFLKI